MSDDFRDFASDVVHLSGGSDLIWAIFRSVDSTNALAKRLLAPERPWGESPEAVLCAWEQSAGKGRHQRHWRSLPGQGILASIVFPSVEQDALSLAPLRVGTALAEFVQGSIDDNVRLKWPNDLYVRDSKIGGVLVESISRGSDSVAIVGYGINHGDRPPQLETVRTTSIGLESDTLSSLASATVDSVRAVLGAFAGEASGREVVERARQLSYFDLGDEIRYRIAEEMIKGVYCGLDERGFLMLETVDGPITVSAGEVSRW